jgi:hypothetical protein
MTMRIGPEPHGPTNVLQVTFVFDDGGALKKASGYQRDTEGHTWGQWQHATKSEVEGRQTITRVLEYLSEVLTAVSKGS